MLYLGRSGHHLGLDGVQLSNELFRTVGRVEDVGDRWQMDVQSIGQAIAGELGIAIPTTNNKIHSPCIHRHTVLHVETISCPTDKPRN